MQAGKSNGCSRRITVAAAPVARTMVRSGVAQLLAISYAARRARRTIRQLHVVVDERYKRIRGVSLTILWPAHRLTRALQVTTTGRAKASIRTENARRAQGSCVAAGVVLGSGHCLVTCECGAGRLLRSGC